MDLGAHQLPQEGSISNMPIPLSYGSIHESSKLRMMHSGGRNSVSMGILTPGLPRPPGGPAIPQEEMNTSRSSIISSAGAVVAPPPSNNSSSDLRGASGANLGGGATQPAAAPPPSASFPPPPIKMVKAAVKYRECMKNHAASIGTHALDGCGEFMPSGEEGSLEALKCAACGCHRNFHRREVDGEDMAAASMVSPAAASCFYYGSLMKERGSLGGGGGGRYGPGTAPLALPPPPHTPMPLAAGMVDDAELGTLISSHMASGGVGSHHLMAGHQYGALRGVHHYGGGGGGMHSMSASPGGGGNMSKKRFRTKFTADQKERMYAFAEKVGWRIQKQDEMAVHRFCSDVGVKRHVFKVWMHNNKNTFGTKKISSEDATYNNSNSNNNNSLKHDDLDNGSNAVSSPSSSSGMQP